MITHLAMCVTTPAVDGQTARRPDGEGQRYLGGRISGQRNAHVAVTMTNK
ncbi:MAG: hypothetical protein ACRDLT_15800 [Solirubrobacteraceae bacterium]